MVSDELVRKLLTEHGKIKPQPAQEWKGPFPLPEAIERFYREIGPLDVEIRSYGNPYFIPRLSKLWTFQAGYRWHGITGKLNEDWDDNWLVVADEGGNPFIFVISLGRVLFDLVGRGKWEPNELFPDLNAMAACLGQLGALMVAAGKQFVDENCQIRPEHRNQALVALSEILDSKSKALVVLNALGWG